MGAAISLGNIVGVAIQPLLKPVVPLQGHLNLHTLIRLSLKMEDFRDWRFALVKKLDKGAQAPLIDEELFLSTAFILEQNSDTAVQKRQFAQALAQHVVVKLDVAERFGGRRESHRSSRVGRFPYNGQRRQWHAMCVALLKQLSFATDSELQVR